MSNIRTIETSNIGNTFTIDSEMGQEKYLELSAAVDTVKMSDAEAIAFVSKEFGFDETRIKVQRTAELNVYTAARATKRIGASILRVPLYNATDWNYIRFRIGRGLRLWEVVNGDLVDVAE